MLVTANLEPRNSINWELKKELTTEYSTKTFVSDGDKLDMNPHRICDRARAGFCRVYPGISELKYRHRPDFNGWVGGQPARSNLGRSPYFGRSPYAWTRSQSLRRFPLCNQIGLGYWESRITDSNGGILVGLGITGILDRIESIFELSVQFWLRVPKLSVRIGHQTQEKGAIFFLGYLSLIVSIMMEYFWEIRRLVHKPHCALNLLLFKSGGGVINFSL